MVNQSNVKVGLINMSGWCQVYKGPLSTGRLGEISSNSTVVLPGRLFVFLFSVQL